jgi:hypothetical protein
MQNVMVERNSFPSHLVIKPKDLGRLLGHFQSSLQEITLIATEPVSTDMDPDSEAKAIELKSYIDPARGKVATFYLTSSHAGACWSSLVLFDLKISSLLIKHRLLNDVFKYMVFISSGIMHASPIHMDAFHLLSKFRHDRWSSAYAALDRPL